MKKMRRMIAALAAAGVLTAVAIPALAADTDNSSSGKVMYSKNNANWCDGNGPGACNGQGNGNGRHCRWNNN